MVFTANDLSNWKDFPKGLKVLLHDGDDFSAAETRSKLESLEYIVTTFTDESEALSAVVLNPKSFHIAIIEVNTSVENEHFKFLEAAKDLLPIIMFSSDLCITTTMKCIALGAVEFLQKPLSSEKLKNIWQHVVHKAFKDKGSSVLEPLKPVKESVVSMFHLDTDEKDPAPLTPQIKQVSRLLKEDCQETINSSIENVSSPLEKGNAEDQDIGESKSVDTTDDNNVIIKEDKRGNEKEEDEIEELKEDDVKPVNRSSRIKNFSSGKASRKKVDWTYGLHKKFVQAVEHLGVEQAIPSRILEFMKVDGLTRHNVASHLQKYRMQRRDVLPEEKYKPRLIQCKENHRQIQRGFQQQHRPVMAYPVWGFPPSGPILPLWPPPVHSSSQFPRWHYPPYQTVNGNVGGYPVGPQVTVPFNTPPVIGTFNNPPANQLDEEMIDQVVKEVISKPWLPLPIGLRPPSTEIVLAELSRQGISAVPSSSSCLINDSSHLH